MGSDILTESSVDNCKKCLIWPLPLDVELTLLSAVLFHLTAQQNKKGERSQAAQEGFEPATPTSLGAKSHTPQSHQAH